MTSFTQFFGGGVVDPTQVSFAAYSISDDLVTSWPFEAVTGADILAAIDDISATTSSLSVYFPNATLASTGQGALIKNTGSYTFTVKSSTGVTLGTVASGEAWFYWLTDNSTASGTWASVQFGASTSSANAAALAGAGLVAVTTQLNQNLVSQSVAGAYAPGVGDLAKVLRSTGGSVVWSPISAVTLGNGWFVYVINAGSGTLTWTPGGGQKIDGAATKVFQPSDTALVFSDGANFWSLGFGQAVSSTVTGVSIPIGGGAGTTTLNATQVAAQVQDYTGALTGNRNVEYGTGVGYWFVRNNTSGAYTVTYKVNGADPGVLVAQGSYSILRSDGSNMAIAFTATSGTVTSVATTADLTGGPITTTGTLGLATTGVVAGSYGAGLNFPAITVDNKGRISAASTVALGSAAGYTAGAAAGNVPVLDSNALLPTANGGMPTGAVIDYVGTSLPTGWVWPNGTTIGSATSGATGRANADTVTLFTLLWNSMADAQAPVSGGRGANAAADFAANKTITVIDLRGRVVAAVDNLGGAASATRLSAVMSSTTQGATGGQSQVTGTATTLTSTAVSGTATGTLTVSGTTDVIPLTGSANTGGGGAFSIVNPGATVGITNQPVSGLPLSVTATVTSGAGTITGNVNTVPPVMVLSKIIKL